MASLPSINDPLTPRQRPLGFGEGLSFLHLNSNRNPRFAVGTLAGRFVLLCVVFDVQHAHARAALDLVNAATFDADQKYLAILAGDPAAARDPLVNRIAETKLVFWDEKRVGIAAWGLGDAAPGGAGKWLLLDPTLRSIAAWPLDQGAAALAAFANAPRPDAHAGVPIHAPVLIAPRIFEPDFCKLLIDTYNREGGTPSGTTKENEQGKTYVSLDDSFKKRSDLVLKDANLRNAAMHRIFWRLLPEIEKAFSFKVTRMERYIVSCYDSGTGGFFKAHRDNTTKGTAHRRFAVTLNLNAEEYEGGDLRFPEFGSRTYRAPTGGAVVFSCSLLHEATPMERGRRYAFLPFLYDDAAAQIRAQNNTFLDDSIGGYEA